MDQEIAKRKDTEAVSGPALLSTAECARLCGVNRCVPSAELDEQIGLVMWRLQGTLSRQERREGYQRLEALLWRKYGGGMQGTRSRISVPPFGPNELAVKAAKD
jgi:hypothetical protein